MKALAPKPKIKDFLYRKNSMKNLYEFYIIKLLFLINFITANKNRLKIQITI